MKAKESITGPSIKDMYPAGKKDGGTLMSPKTTDYRHLHPGNESTRKNNAKPKGIKSKYCGGDYGKMASKPA